MYQQINTQNIVSAFEELDILYSDLQGVGIMTNDGLSLASKLPYHIDEDWLASMSVALVYLGRNSTKQLFEDKVTAASLQSRQGLLIATPCNDYTVLAILLSPDIENYQINRIVTHIRDYIKRFV